MSPYLTLSFSPLINIDGQPHSSEGQNLLQNCSLSPCYQLNGFRWSSPDTEEREVKLGRAWLGTLFTLAFFLTAPFLPTTLKLSAPSKQKENTFNIITLHTPTTQSRDSFGFVRTTHACVHWLQINNVSQRVSVKVYSLTMRHITSAASFVCVYNSTPKMQILKKYLAESRASRCSTMACFIIYQVLLPWMADLS